MRVQSKATGWERREMARERRRVRLAARKLKGGRR